MAVVRKTSNAPSRLHAKATVRYIIHRREMGQKITRPLFGWEEGDTKKLTAYEAIDNAPRGTRFLRIAISPDPKREDIYQDLNLRELTRETMLALAKKYQGNRVQFFAALHEGHTNKRHVNLLVLVPPGPLSKEDWKRLREAATSNAKKQRLELDQEQGIDAGSAYGQAQTVIRKSRLLERAVFTRGASLRRIAPVCPICRGDLDRHGRFLECTNCELTFSGCKYLVAQVERPKLEYSREAGGI